jgi:hypothetical protein
VILQYIHCTRPLKTKHLVTYTQVQYNDHSYGFVQCLVDADILLSIAGVVVAGTDLIGYSKPSTIMAGVVRAGSFLVPAGRLREVPWLLMKQTSKMNSLVLCTSTCSKWVQYWYVKHTKHCL